jgi:hypothetical protein
MSRWNIDDCITFEVWRKICQKFLKARELRKFAFTSISRVLFSCCHYCDPYDSSPEEGDDERSFLSAEAYATNNDVILTDEEQKMLFDRFEDKVNEADLNWEEPEPDYDDRE